MLSIAGKRRPLHPLPVASPWMGNRHRSVATVGHHAFARCAADVEATVETRGIVPLSHHVALALRQRFSRVSWGQVSPQQ